MEVFDANVPLQSVIEENSVVMSAEPTLAASTCMSQNVVFENSSTPVLAVAN